MFGRKRSAPEPAPEAQDSELAADVKDIKRWIAEVATRKFKSLEDSEQRNRDNNTHTNDRCDNNKNDIIKLYDEKDKEKDTRDQEVAGLKKTIRELKKELDGKANRAKPGPGKKPGA